MLAGTDHYFLNENFESMGILMKMLWQERDIKNNFPVVFFLMSDLHHYDVTISLRLEVAANEFLIWFETSKSFTLSLNDTSFVFKHSFQISRISNEQVSFAHPVRFH